MVNRAWLCCVAQCGQRGACGFGCKSMDLDAQQLKPKALHAFAAGEAEVWSLVFFMCAIRE
eukprot:1157384-Pelagomonas_calceolata.AAC.9